MMLLTHIGQDYQLLMTRLTVHNLSNHKTFEIEATLEPEAISNLVKITASKNDLLKIAEVGRKMCDVTFTSTNTKTTLTEVWIDINYNLRFKQSKIEII